jgi:beta-xylosidase
MKQLIILFLLTTCAGTLWADNAYTNPVLHPDNYPDVSSAADPFVFRDADGTYYCYVTGQGFPVFSSKDLVNWTYRGKAFPKARAKWATVNFWAPEMVKIGDTYYLNYTGAVTDDAPKRIGLAKSKSPVGPFDDVSAQPFYKHSEAKGCIDSHIFIDGDGRTFLYYSLAVKQNVVNGVNRSEIWVIELQPDLSGTKGTAKQLFYPTKSWESNVNEAPAIVKRNGIYYLMYSGNGYVSANYAVGYATSSSPMGTFTKYAGNPILIHTGLGKKVTGTGHNSVTTSPDGKELFCVYHSHINLDELGGGPRKVHIDRMGFTSDNVMYIDGPTITSQNYPSASQSSIHSSKAENSPSFFPNPAKDEITVIIPEAGAGNIEISELKGRIIYSSSFPCDTNRVRVPVLSLHAGIYVICLKTADFTKKEIFIKA